MKRLLCLLLVFALLAPFAIAEEPETQEKELVALYSATMCKDAKMRAEPSIKSKFIRQLKENDDIVIYEWGKEWSLVGYKGIVGYVLTDRFYELWQLTEVPLPDLFITTGLAVITREAHVEIEDKSNGDLYSGNDLQPGEMVAVVGEEGLLPFRRGSVTLPADSFTYQPFVPVAEAQPGDLIYAFSTFYNDAVGGSLAEARRYNIELSVERIHGTVLQPGEQFSFNGLCGPYRKSNGYKLAPNISVKGTGYGGGVCQVSTTLFDAVLGLRLQLDKWNVHSVTGIRYAPKNLDAAVGSSKDLRFTNSLSFPIRVDVLTQRGALTAFFYRAE